MSAVEIARALNGHREGRRCQCPVCGRGNLKVADMRGSKNLVKCWNDCDYRAVFRELFEQGLIESEMTMMIVVIVVVMITRLKSVIVASSGGNTTPADLPDWKHLMRASFDARSPKTWSGLQLTTQAVAPIPAGLDPAARAASSSRKSPGSSYAEYH